jgi:2-methylcitrate dehydratase PrpD
LINSGKFTADEIETVVLTVGPFGRGHLCEPLDEKRSPKLPIGAKLSLPFAVALALSRGHVLISDFLAPSLVDPAVLAMASRVSYVYDPLVGDPPGTGTPAKVAVRTTDGREFEFVVDVLLGHPSRPMDRNLVEEKFRDCAQYSATTFSSDRIDELVDSIWNLESLESASTICDLLS